ncbi:hypothetical protein TO73_1811 [Thermus aquaticus Y51MC23]|uniref:Uncharacterized protein n=1 Tax=Thermus aquaticus (strain ATCC BAA-2747 / Y51MC23) TaxID=498848 RepID=A0ABN4IJ54_THEA5|nr:hypothetical protein TO73_1811 [Thermus aquaticus Y51MC23]
MRLGESSRGPSRPKRARKAGPGGEARPRGEAQEPCPSCPQGATTRVTREV